jgi:hypothetical protein
MINEQQMLSLTTFLRSNSIVNRITTRKDTEKASNQAISSLNCVFNLLEDVRKYNSLDEQQQEEMNFNLQHSFTLIRRQLQKKSPDTADSPLKHFVRYGLKLWFQEESVLEFWINTILS